MLKGFQGNFKNRYLGENIKCEGCNQELDTQGHVVDCEEYADIKEGLDLRTVTLFRFSSNGSWGPELGQLSKTFW